MSHDLSALFTIVLSVGFGLLAQVLAHRWRTPAIVLLLLFGVILGPSALGIIEPDSIGEGLNILVKLAVAVILFEGALNLRLTALKQGASEVRNLVTFGVLITWGLVSLITRYITRFDWSLAILFGAIVTVTGPTVVQPLLKRINVSRRVKTVLEGEAIFIDPIGAILAVVVLEIIQSQSIETLPALWNYFGRLIIGLLVGASSAVILSRLMKTPRLIPSELSNLVALAFVWVSFGIAESIQGESGIMASVAMGLVLQSRAVPGETQLRYFKESLTILSISVLFILLSAKVQTDAILSEGLSGVIVIFMMMFLVRPISVFLSTLRTGLSWREKVFISWIGPRGIVAASMASLFVTTFKGVDIVEGNRLLALTFLTIMITVTLQGLTASRLAHLLGLHSMEGRKAVIIGAGRFGLKIASILQEYGRPVVLVDTNESLIERARQLGFDTAHGNALEEEVLKKAGIEEAETLVAVTSNSEVNVLTSQIAGESFGIKRAFPTLSNLEKGAGPKLLEQTGGRLAFGKAVDVISWEYALDRAQQLLWEVPKTWLNTSIGKIQFIEGILPILHIRGKNAELAHAEQLWQPGDKVVFLIRISPEQAIEQLLMTCKENKA